MPGLARQRQGHRFLRSVGGIASLRQGSGSGRQLHCHTHSSADCLDAGGSETRACRPKAVQACRALNGRTSWPVEETPSYAAVLDMVRKRVERGTAQTPPSAHLWTRRPLSGDALWKRRSSNGTTSSTRRNTQEGWPFRPRDSSSSW